MFLKSGLSTDGDTDRVLLVGPTAPATKRLQPDKQITIYVTHKRNSPGVRNVSKR